MSRTQWPNAVTSKSAARMFCQVGMHRRQLPTLSCAAGPACMGRISACATDTEGRGSSGLCIVTPVAVRPQRRRRYCPDPPPHGDNSLLLASHGDLHCKPPGHRNRMVYPLMETMSDDLSVKRVQGRSAKERKRDFASPRCCCAWILTPGRDARGSIFPCFALSCCCAELLGSAALVILRKHLLELHSVISYNSMLNKE